MYEIITPVLVSAAASAAGLMAGVYFIFSACILRAFDRLGPEAASAAMNSINEDILRSAFMPLFFGSTLLYAGLALFAVLDGDLNNRWILLSSAIIYVVGMFVCTAARNVPLNQRLEAAQQNASETQMWPIYRIQWARWNHLRACACLIACLLSIAFLIA